MSDSSQSGSQQPDSPVPGAGAEPSAHPAPTFGSGPTDQSLQPGAVTTDDGASQEPPVFMEEADGSSGAEPSELSNPPDSTEDVPRNAGPNDADRVVGTSDSTDDSSRTEVSLPRVIAVANQKGGVGKTTTTVNMGAALAELGHRVLIVDLDPQGNATTGLGINYRILDNTMYDVMLGGLPIEDCIEPTEVKGLFVAPASLDLAGAEVEMVSAFNRESKLSKALSEVFDDFDYFLIDCPPSLGLLTVNGLVAATEVMVPIQCEYYALEGLAQLTRNIDLIRDNLNPKLHIAHIVMVMYDNRTKLAEQVVEEVREHFGKIVCRNMIPRNVKLSEAPSFGQPITTYASSSRGAVAYRELAREVSGVV